MVGAARQVCIGLRCWLVAVLVLLALTSWRTPLPESHCVWLWDFRDFLREGDGSGAGWGLVVQLCVAKVARPFSVSGAPNLVGRHAL